MKIRHIVLMLFALYIIPAHCQNETETPRQLSDSAFASILTCGPGREYYESFGHCAIRVCDSSSGIDQVYNFGSFNFSEPHFYLHFSQGRLNYFVEPMDFAEFVFYYKYYGQAIWEQQLRLQHCELENLFQDLENAIKPENKYYRYDPFRNNCATKVRDVVEQNSVLFRNSYPDEKWTPKSGLPHTTYRDLIHKYTDKNLLWWQFGTDILLGARCDRPLNKREFMYMPIDMMTQFDTTVMENGMTMTEPRRTLATQVNVYSPTIITPSLCFLLLFAAVLLLTLLAPKKGWTLTWLDATLFSTASLVSLLLLFLWFGSDHYCTKWNLNLLWANPLFIWLLCRLRKPCRVPAIITACCLLLVPVIWLVGWPQHFNSAAVLIALTLLVRVLVKLKVEN